MQHTFKRVTTYGRIAAIVHVFEFDIFFTRTVQHHFMHGRAQAGPWGFNVEFIVFSQRLKHLEIIEVTAIPTTNSTTGQRQFRVLNHPVRIEILLHAETVTGWTRARWVVKREQAGFQFAHAIAADRAGEVGGEQKLFRFRVVHIGDHRRTTGQFQRGFKGFSQSLSEVVAYLKAVNHHFNSVFLLQLKLGRIGKVTHFAVDTGADIALARQVFQRFGVLAFTLLNYRCQQHQTFAFRLGQDVVHHLANGLGCQGNVVIRTARLANAGKQQTQIVVNFGNCTYRGSRVMGRRFLFN